MRERGERERDRKNGEKRKSAYRGDRRERDCVYKYVCVGVQERERGKFLSAVSFKN